MIDDILFQDGDVQEFIVEVPSNTLNSPDDILFGAAFADACVYELTLVATNTVPKESVIFIIG